MTTVEIDSRTIDGECFLSARDLTKGLRIRADEMEAQARELGEYLDDDAYIDCVAFHTVARELRTRADDVEFAVLIYMNADPGDTSA